MGVDDRSSGVVEFVGVEFAEIDRLVFEADAETIEHFADGGVNAIALVLECCECWAFGFGAVGELAGESCCGAVGVEKFVEGFLFGGCEADAGTGFGQISGVGVEFF